MGDILLAYCLTRTAVAAVLVHCNRVGTGGDCKKYGPGNMCRDQPFTGYTCAKGLTCERQNNFYYQCVKPDRNSIDSNTDKPSTTGGNQQASSPSASTAGPSIEALREGEQCGGKGAKCKDYDACVDKPFPGYACGQGLTCNRQNEWYHQVSRVTLLGWQPEPHRI